MPQSPSHPELDALREENARLRGDLLTLSRRISHDLRTPLSGIGIAGAALAESRTDQGFPAAALSQSLAESVAEIAALVERVSFIAKASAEPQAMERVSMAEVVWAALQRLERRLLKKGVAVNHPSSWPTVAGVAPWIEVVWVDLIANALQWGGSAPRIELGWRQEKDEYIFWVDDDGPGVPEKHVATLFEPFDRRHKMSAPRGLGLAIVQRLVSLQAGRCGYAALPGGGSHFFFTLPASR